MLVRIWHGITVDGYSYFVVASVITDIIHIRFHVTIYRTQYAITHNGIWNICDQWGYTRICDAQIQFTYCLVRAFKSFLGQPERFV